MKIKKDAVVSFRYRLSDSDGVALGDSGDHEPVTYLHGHGSLVPGLEAGLLGLEAGASTTVTVPPEQGYGPRRDLATQRIPIKRLLGSKRPRPGDVVAIQADDGTRQMTVVKVGKFNVDVDPNHPLAGRTLQFEVELLEVRDATAEELAHGHAHGPGGHQH
jgi:FKBP-type peptidyl-prolyl cis-trans isomerase SlyD